MPCRPEPGVGSVTGAAPVQLPVLTYGDHGASGWCRSEPCFLIPPGSRPSTTQQAVRGDSD
jgi:hypothetical protein